MLSDPFTDTFGVPLIISVGMLDRIFGNEDWGGESAIAETDGSIDNTSTTFGDGERVECVDELFKLLSKDGGKEDSRLG